MEIRISVWVEYSIVGFYILHERCSVTFGREGRLEVLEFFFSFSIVVALLVLIISVHLAFFCCFVCI